MWSILGFQCVFLMGRRTTKYCKERRQIDTLMRSRILTVTGPTMPSALDVVDGFRVVHMTVKETKSYREA